MSAQSATSCFHPSLEGLDNRIIPSLLPRFGAPGLPANRVAGVHVGRLGRRVVLSNLVDSAAGGAGSGKEHAQLTRGAARFGNALSLPLKAGGHRHSDSPIAFDVMVQGDPAPTESVGEALIAGSHDLVTTGANGSLCALARPNSTYPGCPPGRPI